MRKIVQLMTIGFGLSGLVACTGDPTSTCQSSSVAGGGSVEPCISSGGSGGGIPIPSTKGHVLKISTGSVHSCALMDDNTVKCWGDNFYGQLGNGTMGGFSSVPVAVNGLTRVSNVYAMYGTTTCAIDFDRNVYCWGFNGNWPIPLVNSMVATSQPTLVPGVSNVLDLADGPSHVCALIGDGTVSCWGNCGYGQCGDGIVRLDHDGVGPMTIPGITDAMGVAVYHDQTCILRKNGTEACLGEVRDFRTNQVSYLLEPTTIHSSPLEEMQGINSIAMGYRVWYAITNTSKQLYVWGTSYKGQLGLGRDTSIADYPTPIADPPHVRSVSGSYSNSCVITDILRLYCWGGNESGSAGVGGEDGFVVTPTKVDGLTGVSSLSMGYYAVCAVANNNNAYCWGQNANGKLGDGTTEDRRRPVLVVGL